MTLLDRKILSVKNSKATCESLNPQKHEQSPTQSGIALDSRKYCFDDADIRMLLARNIRNQAFAPYLQKILSQPYTTGIHVFRCPVRASSRIRKMAAVSYLNDFMPAPLAVHFILPTSPQKYASLHVPVNQDIENRDRLINTPLATSAAKRGKTINLRKEVTSLAAHVNNKGAATNLKYEKEIVHEDFVDDSKKILEELGAKVEELNFQEKNYFNSLQQSVRTKYPTKYFYEALLVSREKDWQAWRSS
ncbi:hypothetical protein JCM33374_g2876 [Metschnikowia sp. JCM 33374]|nr:hypothetical protein JCM33374_g2876 [Metschnikowia sp. JCM 33374]